MITQRLKDRRSEKSRKRSDKRNSDWRERLKSADWLKKRPRRRQSRMSTIRKWLSRRDWSKRG